MRAALHPRTSGNVDSSLPRWTSARLTWRRLLTRRVKAILAVSSLSVIVVPAPASAQTVYDDEGVASEGQLELLKPLLEDGGLGGAFTFAAVLNGRFRLGPKVALRLDLPFVRGAFEADGVAPSGARLGNPLIGVRYAPADSGTMVEFLVRMPLDVSGGDVEPVTVGVVADFDRSEAYLAKVFSAKVRGQISRPFTERGLGQVAAGLAVAHDLDDTPQAPDTTPANGAPPPGATGYAFTYETAFLYTTGRVVAGPSLTGVFPLNGVDPWWQRSVHQLGFGAEVRTGRVVPFGRVRIPFGRSLDPMQLVWSMGIKVKPTS